MQTARFGMLNDRILRNLRFQRILLKLYFIEMRVIKFILQYNYTEEHYLLSITAIFLYDECKHISKRNIKILKKVNRKQ